MNEAELYAILAKGSKSFSFASHFLAPESRLYAASLYAWCRHVDDAIDEIPASEQPAALVALREELRSVYAGEPQEDAVLAAFQRLVQDRALPREYADELLEGMAMDAREERYADVAALLQYCHRVAGVVGLMMVHVLGVSDPVALRPAAHLGIAFQLTNISRDVQEDWGLGRRYVPDSLLGDAAARLDPELGGELPGAEREVLAAAVKRMLDLADDYYASADRGVPHLPWRSALAIRAARWVYWGIGERVRKRGYDVYAGRAWVPLAGKIRLAARGLLQELVDLPRRWQARARYLLPEHTIHFPADVVDGDQPRSWVSDT